MTHDTADTVRQSILERAAHFDFPALVMGGVGLGPGESAWRARIARAFAVELDSVSAQLSHLEAREEQRRAAEPVRFEPNPDFGEVPSVDIDLLEAMRAELTAEEERRRIDGERFAQATIRAMFPKGVPPTR